jgi:hypothetical protein
MSRIRDFLPHQDGTIQAWVQFDGTTGGTTIRDDFNVASTTDSGTGDYTVTIDVDFANDDYSVTAMGGVSGSVLATDTESAASCLVGAHNIRCVDASATFTDGDIVCNQCVGDTS